MANRKIEDAAPNDRAFDADDLAQEISVAVSRGRHYFRPDRGRLMTWLARMASRTARSVRCGTLAARRNPTRTCTGATLKGVPVASSDEPVQTSE